MADAPDFEAAALGDVRPSLIADGPPDRGVLQIVGSCDLGYLSIFAGVLASDDTHEILSEDCAARIFASGSATTICSSAFRDHDGNDVKLCAQEQMAIAGTANPSDDIDPWLVISDARWIVAGVECQEPWRDRLAAGHFPSDAVSETTTGPWINEHSVAGVIRAACPRPARSARINSLHQEIGEWFTTSLPASKTRSSRRVLERLPTVDANARGTVRTSPLASALRVTEQAATFCNDVRPREERIAAPLTGTLDGRLTGHQAYSWCQAPGVDARRGHFMSTFYHMGGG